VVDHPRGVAVVVPGKRYVLKHLTLARSVEGEGGDTALEQEVFEHVALFLRALEPAEQHRAWHWTIGSLGPAQVADDYGVVDREVDALSRRVKQGSGSVIEPGLTELALRPYGAGPSGDARRTTGTVRTARPSIRPRTSIQR